MSTEIKIKATPLEPEAMTNQITQTAGIPEQILMALHTLSPERKQQVFDFVEFLAQKQENAEASHSPQDQRKPSKQRVLGQHKGMAGLAKTQALIPLPERAMHYAKRARTFVQQGFQLTVPLGSIDPVIARLS